MSRARACDYLAQEGSHLVGFLRCAMADVDSELVDVLLNHAERRVIRATLFREAVGCCIMFL